jgi:hypothetical protein
MIPADAIAPSAPAGWPLSRAAARRVRMSAARVAAVRKADQADVEPGNCGGVGRGSTRARSYTANDDTHEECHDGHMKTRDR